MKPGDHPDFFRFPPPAGRSRESTIVLDGSGRFWHDGTEVTHGGMADAFAGWIQKHPDDGRFILTNGYDWTYFSVEDVPFFVKSVRLDGDAVTLFLSDGTQEALDPETLSAGDRDALYLRVKGGEFEARFMPAAQLALAPLVQAGPDGQAELCVGGKSFQIGPRPPLGPAVGPPADKPGQ